MKQAISDDGLIAACHVSCHSIDEPTLPLSSTSPLCCLKMGSIPVEVFVNLDDLCDGDVEHSAGGAIIQWHGKCC